VLGYSRRKHYTASLDETQASIFEAIESCLRHFGASPKQLLLDYVARHIIALLCPIRLCGRNDREAGPDVGVQHRPAETGHITRPA